MEYEVFAGDRKVGIVKTTGTETGERRLINTFGSIATDGLPDRWQDCEFQIDWPLVDVLGDVPWSLRDITNE